MDNEQDTCQAKGCDTVSCETNNSTQSQAVVNPEMWGNGHLAIICQWYMCTQMTHNNLSNIVASVKV